MAEKHSEAFGAIFCYILVVKYGIYVKDFFTIALVFKVLQSLFFYGFSEKKIETKLKHFK